MCIRDRGYRELVKEIKTQQTDILHAHMGHAIILATLLKFRFPSIKLVFTSQNYVMDSGLGTMITYLFKWVRNADIIFSKDMAHSIYRKDAVIIPNGIDTKYYNLDIPKFEKFTFVCTGRLTKQKNQSVLMEPIKELKKEGYQFEVLLIGEGEDRAKIEQAIEENEVQDCVQMLGLRRDIPTLTNRAHCLIMPSLWEGLPLAMLEAACCNLPVIITDVGSVSSLINKDTGYLIQDLRDIPVFMKEVMDNYEVALQKASRLKKVVENQYDVTIIARNHETLYARLLDKQNYKLPVFD